jgi:hypothetical protein
MTLEIGESAHENGEFITTTDPIHFQVNDVSIGLWKGHRRKELIFPVSNGEVQVTDEKVLCRKRRAEREQMIIGSPGAVSGMNVVNMSVNKKGWQWLRFDIDDIQTLGRTMLLKYRIIIDDDGERYEVIISDGQKARRLMNYLEKKKLGG